MQEVVVLLEQPRTWCRCNLQRVYIILISRELRESSISCCKADKSLRLRK